MYRIYAITDIGNVRAQNQDGFFIDGIICADEKHREVYYETDADIIHLAVFDGVGSTEFAVDAVRQMASYMRENEIIASESDIRQYVDDMNHTVFSYLTSVGKMDAASTVVGMVLDSGSAFFYNIGDSPGFSVKNGYLEKLTVDDTKEGLFGSADEGGEIETEGKQPLLQAIGSESSLDIVHVARSEGDNVFFICSDGITDLISIDEIEDEIQRYDSLRDISRAIVDDALSNGGVDNATMMIVSYEED